MATKVQLPNNSEVNCEKCDVPATRIDVFVHTPGKGGKYVTIESHAVCVTDPAFVRDAEQVREFFDVLHDLEDELDTRVGGKIPLEVGYIAEIDLAPVHACGCDVFTDVTPQVTVRAFGRNLSVELPTRPLTDVDIAAVIEEAKEPALKLAQAFKEKVDSGQY